MTLPTRENLRATVYAFADIRLNPFVLFLRHHRSNGGLGISRITDGKSPHRFADAPLYFVEPAFRHEEARPGSAGLVACHKSDGQIRRNPPVEVGVVQPESERFFTQLEPVP